MYCGLFDLRDFFFFLLPFTFLPAVPKTSLPPLSYLCRYEGGERKLFPADTFSLKICQCQGTALSYSL